MEPIQWLLICRFSSCTNGQGVRWWNQHPKKQRRMTCWVCPTRPVKQTLFTSFTPYSLLLLDHQHFSRRPRFPGIALVHTELQWQTHTRILITGQPVTRKTHTFPLVRAATLRTHMGEYCASSMPVQWRNKCIYACLAVASTITVHRQVPSTSTKLMKRQCSFLFMEWPGTCSASVLCRVV